MHTCRKSPLKRLHWHQDVSPQRLVGASLEDRTVHGAFPIRRSLARVVVGSEGNTRKWRRCCNRRHAVKANFARLENHTAIECRRERLSTVRYILIPELDMSPPSLLPARVEIN